MHNFNIKNLIKHPVDNNVYCTLLLGIRTLRIFISFLGYGNKNNFLGYSTNAGDVFKTTDFCYTNNKKPSSPIKFYGLKSSITL